MAKRRGVDAAAAAAGEAAAGQVDPVQGFDEQQQANEQGAAVARQELDDLQKLREQLQKQTARADAAEQRLARLQEADAHILAAEIVAQKKHAALVELDAQRKEAKAQYDAAVADLRARLRDRASGQPNLFAPQDLDGAGPRGQETKNKPEKASKAESVAPESATVSPATPSEAAEAGEDVSSAGAAVAPPQREQQEWWLLAGLGSVSVAGESPGEMVSLPPSTIKMLAKAGITTVAQAAEMLAAGSKVEGLGATGRKRLESILTQWCRESAAGGPAQQRSDDGEAGRATERLCGKCGSRWGLPSSVVTCPECGEQMLVYDVGFYGEPNCDVDGDYVGCLERLEFQTPKTKAQPGMEQYSFVALLAKTSTGDYVPGWEIVYEDAVGDALYPNVRHVCVPRDAALRRAAEALRDAAFRMIASEQARDVWLKAAAERFGIELKVAA